MQEHKTRLNEVLHELEEVVVNVPAEKQEEVRLFLEGNLTALEQEVRKRQ